MHRVYIMHMSAKKPSNLSIKALEEVLFRTSPAGRVLSNVSQDSPWTGSVAMAHRDTFSDWLVGTLSAVVLPKQINLWLQLQAAVDDTTFFFVQLKRLLCSSLTPLKCDTALLCSRLSKCIKNCCY